MSVWRFLGVALFAAAVVSPATAATPGPMRVTAQALNVRSGPGTQHGVVAQVTAGQVYPALRWSGSWLEIQLGARRAWAHGLYLAPTTTPVMEVTASSLNVRSGPGGQYRVLGRLAQGTSVAVRSTRGDWKNINFEGGSAWVHGGFLSFGAAPAPSRATSRAGFIQLAASGPGFYAYGAAYKRWGTPRLVYAIERAARRWQSVSHGRVGVGNISLENGGVMPPHSSHQRGVDVDVIPARSDGRELGVTIYDGAYSRARTQQLMDLIRSEVSVRVILFNDRGTRGTQSWPGHDNHFHLSVN